MTLFTWDTHKQVVIDRGAFPGAVSLELFVDGSFVTNIEVNEHIGLCF
jgi:hypothetical protein